ncbi:GSCFA family protein [Albidovulum inexpectatum]|uniref:GSCFA family protein n=1 Tax=Albidovulum inexpectatum TaxID=196587 RepID=A0A2S5JGW6_9RHOB|nr:GSCFA domain-containing protein [Albidovulum inexpectatum]PPB80744.1 GSCFA family protein [Albidovulum inexpectatum]
MRQEGSLAFRTTLRNKMRKYPDRNDSRFRNDLILPSINPSFGIARDSAVFTIGSCFAREVEDALLTAGVRVPTAHFAAPHDEAPGRPNRILNQYNPGTMLQCVLAAGQAVDERALYPASDDGMVLDSLLATGNRPVSRERALERRGQINTLYRDGLAESDTVVITLGLIEAWYDWEAELYLNEVPPRPMLDRFGARFEFRRMGLEECRDIMERMVNALTADRKRHIVLTVSPVPLQVTFAGGDAVVANAYSKALLRVLAEQIAEDHASVDYFPSYEIVTTAGLRAFGEDNVHVRPVVVQQIVSHMLEHYLEA